MRRFTDGAELGDTSFWDYKSPTYPTYITSTYKRSGTYSYVFNYYIDSGVKYFPATSEFYFRFGLNPFGANAFGHRTLVFRSGGTVISDLYISGAGYLEARVNGGWVSQTTHTLIQNTWNLIEVHYKMADSGDFEIKLNGVLEVDYSGDTKPGADTTINNFSLATDYDNCLAIDDMALNDTDNSDGKGDISWCGDGHIEYLPANANGDVNNWMGSDGDKTNNYLLVDEIPSDNDSTYVTISGVGIQDMYNLSSFTDTNKIVSRIYPEARVRDASSSASKVKLGLKTGGNVYLGSGIVLGTNYARVIGDNYLINPVGSGVWTKTDLDAIQFVVESL